MICFIYHSWYEVMGFEIWKVALEANRSRCNNNVLGFEYGRSTEICCQAHLKTVFPDTGSLP